MNRFIPAAAAAIAITLLLGQVTDRTTGQPLRNVEVSVHSGASTLHAETNSHGRFRIAGVAPGKHTLRYSSDDVPPQSVKLDVRGKTQKIAITACSTTLDYSCAEGGGGGGGS